MEIGGVKLRFLKSQIDDIKNEMEMISSRTSSQVLERTKKENERKKHTRAMDSARKEIEASRNEVLASEEELEKHRTEVAQLEQEVEEARVAILEKEDALTELKKTTKEKRELVDKTLSAEIELVNTIEHLQKAFRGFRLSLKRNTEEFGKLTLHAIHQIPQVNTREDSEDDAEDEEQKEEDYLEIVEYSPEELSDVNPLDVEREVKTLESKLEDVVIDISVIQDYIRRAKEYNTRRAELTEVTTQREAKKRRCESLQKQRLDEFLEGFNLISLKLKEMYQMITMGGNAELELVDSLDPFSEGILFSVMPPKKSWKNISNLSGGEKTLSSLALVFALHHYKPTPLYVMDEIDAALDFRNVSIVANYIRERTKNGQFIVISLRNNMFELASQLVGIYKVNNMTKSVAIKNKEQLSERSLLQMQQQHRRSATISASQPSQVPFDRRSTVGSMYGSSFSRPSGQTLRQASVGATTASSSRQSSVAPGEGLNRKGSVGPNEAMAVTATKQGSHVSPMTVLPDEAKQEKEKGETDEDEKTAEPEKIKERSKMGGKKEEEEESSTSGSEQDSSEDEEEKQDESDKENTKASKESSKKKVDKLSDSSEAEEEEEEEGNTDKNIALAPRKIAKNKVEESSDSSDEEDEDTNDKKDIKRPKIPPKKALLKKESSNEPSDSNDDDDDDDDSIEFVSSIKHESPKKVNDVVSIDSSDEEESPKLTRSLRKRPQRRESAPTGGKNKKIKKEESSSDESDDGDDGDDSDDADNNSNDDSDDDSDDNSDDNSDDD